MNYTAEQKRKLLKNVEVLMKKCSMPIRDTWTGWDGENMDDAISNNGESGGPRLFDVILTEGGKANVSGHQKYPIDKFDSLAYQNYKVYIPKRLAALKNPVIHETVHFLQQNTAAMDLSYIQHKPELDNYDKYINQRQEIEAHFVQILYILESELEVVDKRYRKDFARLVKAGIKNPNKRIDAILFAINKGII